MTDIAPSGLRGAGGFARRLLAACVLVTAASAPVIAQEPLFLRIRPQSDGDVARAARELLWARRQAHARAVIESVCTGCLGAWRADAPAPAPVPASADARIADLAVETGVELDPGSGASDPSTDPTVPERHP